MPSNATFQGTKLWSLVALNVIIKRWLAANPVKYAWGDASLPHHLFPASLSSALTGNWEGATERELLGKLGPPLPTSSRFCGTSRSSVPAREEENLSHGGAHGELCASLSSTRRDSAPDPPHLCHRHTAGVTGRVCNGTGKSNEHLKHKQVLLTWVQALCWAHRDSRLWHRFLCRFMTHPGCSRGNDPDLQNSSGEKLQNFKNN